MKHYLKEKKHILSFDFVDVDGLYVPSNELKFLGCGANGSVWKWDNGEYLRALKCFFDGRYHLSLSFDICLIMQKLNFVNLPNIYSPLRRSNNTSFSYDGYLMEYFDISESSHLNELPSNNLILSVEQIE